MQEKCQIQLTLAEMFSILDMKKKGGVTMLYNIKKIRVELGMTQEELVQLSGVTRATISRLESGEEVEVKIGTLKAIANAMKCKVSDLLCA